MNKVFRVEICNKDGKEIYYVLGNDDQHARQVAMNLFSEQLEEYSKLCPMTHCNITLFLTLDEDYRVDYHSES